MLHNFYHIYDHESPNFDAININGKILMEIESNCVAAVVCKHNIMRMRMRVH